MGQLHWLCLSIAVIILDQVTKHLAAEMLEPYQSVSVVSYLNLTLMYNTGAAFSFLSDASGWQRWFFIGLSAVVSVSIMLWLWRIPREQLGLALALSLILGGALGNCADRLLYGHVIDFIDVYYGKWHWPAFNVADSAITLGVGILLVDSLFGTRTRARQGTGRARH
jgi:lipoprotein signal peptidase